MGGWGWLAARNGGGGAAPQCYVPDIFEITG